MVKSLTKDTMVAARNAGEAAGFLDEGKAGLAVQGVQ